MKSNIVEENTDLEGTRMSRYPASNASLPAGRQARAPIIRSALGEALKGLVVLYAGLLNDLLGQVWSRRLAVPVNGV